MQCLLAKLEIGIAKHCLGAKIVLMHVCNFNSEIVTFKTKVPLQVARTLWLSIGTIIFPRSKYIEQIVPIADIKSDSEVLVLKSWL